MNNYLPPKTEDFQNFIHRVYPGELHEQQVTFQVTEDCCLQCTYCYQHNKSNNTLSFETAKIFIDNLLQDKYETITRYNTKGIVLDFIGGEPLLEIELISQIIDYCFEQMIILNHPWLYYSMCNICSNGILYQTEKVQNFFQKYGLLCHYAISIDGNKELHDKCRIDKNGNGSYDIALSAAKLYKKQFLKDAPTKMTLVPNNISYLSEAIFSLINEGYEEIPVNCAFEEGWTIEHAKILYNEMKIIADYLIDNDLYNKIFIALFDENYFQPMNETDTQNWCGGTSTGNCLAINYTGKIYPCIRYMESSLNNKQPEIYFGTVNNGLFTTEIEQNNYTKINNITRQSQSTQECLQCPIAEGCAWCSAYNYEVTGSVNKRLTYICIMHKARALANIYYWNKLYKKLNLSKVKINYLPDEESLLIIEESELDNLKILTQ